MPKEKGGDACQSVLHQMVVKAKQRMQREKRSNQDSNPVDMTKLNKTVGDELHRLKREILGGLAEAEAYKRLRAAGAEAGVAQQYVQQIVRQRPQQQQS